MSIPKDYLDLFLGRHFACVATVNEKCLPQVTPVWIDYDVERRLIVVNTAKGRVKTRNFERTKKVALCILDSHNPYRYISVQGEVVEMTEAGATEHILELARKYRGKDASFPLAEGEVRVKVFIKPITVSPH